MITVILSDGIGSATFTFILNVTNTAPKYATTPANKIMNAGEKLTYCMPLWVDSEGGSISATVRNTNKIINHSTEYASFFSLWMEQMEVHTFLMSFSAMAISILLTNSN